MMYSGAGGLDSSIMLDVHRTLALFNKLGNLCDRVCKGRVGSGV